MQRIQRQLAQHAVLARRLNAEYEATSVGVDVNSRLEERDLRRLVVLADEAVPPLARAWETDPYHPIAANSALLSPPSLPLDAPLDVRGLEPRSSSPNPGRPGRRAE